jgi:hypothetical protein
MSRYVKAIGVPFLAQPVCLIKTGIYRFSVKPNHTWLQDWDSVMIKTGKNGKLIVSDAERGAVAARPPNIRPRKEAAKSYKVKPVAEIMQIELSNNPRPLVEPEALSGR